MPFNQPSVKLVAQQSLITNDTVESVVHLEYVLTEVGTVKVLGGADADLEVEFIICTTTTTPTTTATTIVGKFVVVFKMFQDVNTCSTSN